jgi:hypothetical protein
VRSIYKMPRRTRSGPTALGKKEKAEEKAKEEAAYATMKAEYELRKALARAPTADSAPAIRMRKLMAQLKATRKMLHGGRKRGTRRR